MSTSTNGMMIYGYDFGDPSSLLLAEAQRSDTNEYGYFKTSRWDDEHEVTIPVPAKDPRRIW